jgi:mutual gliding-motility protein MglA
MQLACNLHCLFLTLPAASQLISCHFACSPSLARAGGDSQTLASARRWTANGQGEGPFRRGCRPFFSGHAPLARALEAPEGCAIKKSRPARRTVPFINFPAREINCKLVYYGPGLGGKTANLQWVYDNTGNGQKGKMISLATETDRTLFFDFLPLDLGTVRGFKTRLHLYTVPGQVFYEASRKLILKGADGVVFVADSQPERLDANLETLENLKEHLQEHRLDFGTIPYVLQLNKRDLPNVASREDLTQALQLKGEPVMEAVAIRGEGVFETLREIAKLVLAELKKGT